AGECDSDSAACASSSTGPCARAATGNRAADSSAASASASAGSSASDLRKIHPPDRARLPGLFAAKSDGNRRRQSVVFADHVSRSAVLSRFLGTLSDAAGGRSGGGGNTGGVAR